MHPPPFPFPQVRLAWHDAGTYNAADKTGGANGTIRFDPECGHAANAGLTWATKKLEPIKEKHPDVGYADLYQLASALWPRRTATTQGSECRRPGTRPPSPGFSACRSPTPSHALAPPPLIRRRCGH